MPTTRLAAIMFTDIVGYTAMMQSDQAKAMAAVKSYEAVLRERIAHHKGELIQTYGDGSLSIFDSASAAVNCAKEIQETIREIVPLRIGIHLGEITRDGDHTFGDGVNIASRIESMGVSGAVLVSSSIRQQIKNKPEFELESLGKFSFKNVAEPMTVYALANEDFAVPKPGEMKGKGKKVKEKKNTTHAIIRMASIGFVAMAVGATLFWTVLGVELGTSDLSKAEKIKWAYQTAIPEIERLVDNLYIHQKQSGYGPEAWEAFQLIEEVEGILPDDSTVQELKTKCSRNIYINSSPSGAMVYAKGYSQRDSAFQYMGTTPIENKIFPSSYISLKIEKKGYETIQDVILVGEIVNNGWKYTLDSVGIIPLGMSMVRPNVDTILQDSQLQLIWNSPDQFFIDKQEVSNQEYMVFVAAGGYQNPAFWQEPFMKEGKELAWETAVSEFVDQTGRPGPSTWVGGTYPEGEENFPVEGVNWFEAAAYAQFAGKQLPSMDHVKYLAGGFWIAHEMMNSSHLNASRSRERSSESGKNLWGVYDLYGNVREWCYNRVGNNFRSIVGASYDDEDYLTNQFLNGRSPFDRSKGNGFRCIQSFQYPQYAGPHYEPIMANFRNYDEETVVSDAIFEGFLNLYVYDKQAIDSQLIYSREERYWTRQKVSFTTPSGNEQMAIYVFLPKNATPPYQTLVYWPGWSASMMPSSEEFLEIGQVDFFVKNGRAIVIPVLTGTYERQKSAQGNCQDQRICGRNNTITWTKEIQKTIDFIESRPDLDAERIGFVGKSWGALNGPLPMAVDKRIKVGVFHLGGLPPNWHPLPEVDIKNYCPRVEQPILMLNGKYDNIRPYIESVLPMYNLLGTPKNDKILKMYNDAHMVPRKEFIREGLAFLDTYLGAVK